MLLGMCQCDSLVCLSLEMTHCITVITHWITERLGFPPSALHCLLRYMLTLEIGPLQ